MSLNFYKDETEKVCKSKGWDRAAVDTVCFFLQKSLVNWLQPFASTRRPIRRRVSKRRGVQM